MIKIQGIDPNMIANNLTPAYPTHPGEVVKDEIEYRGISQRKLACYSHAAGSRIRRTG